MRRIRGLRMAACVLFAAAGCEVAGPMCRAAAGNPSMPAAAGGGDEQREAGATRVSPLVKGALEGEFLTELERSDLRVAHGLETAEDLARTAPRARAALQRGVYLDASLRWRAGGPQPEAGSPEEYRLDCAEAALRRGDLDEVLRLTGASAGVRAARLRAEVWWEAGDISGAARQANEAIAHLAALAAKTTNEPSPQDLIEAARAGVILLRCGDAAPAHEDGAANEGAVEAQFQSVMSLLARARRADPLSWQAPLAEAEVLFEKDNFPEAVKALESAALLNPASARVLALQGQIAVASFNVAAVAALAQRLDQVVAEFAALTPNADGAPSPDDAKANAAAPVPAIKASFEAAELRARIAIRQDDPESALAALSELTTAAPRAEGIGAAALMAAAITLAPEELQQRLDAIDAWGADVRAPGIPLDTGEGARRKPAWPYAAAGKALCDARQYAEAARLLEEAQRRAPAWGTPPAELGLVQVQAGNDDRALAALRAAAALDPFNVRVANSLKLIEGLAALPRVEGEHFVIRAAPGVDLMLAREMLPRLERSFAIVTGDAPGGLRTAPPGKTLIDLMPAHAPFAVRIAGMPRIHTIAASTGPVIAMEAPRSGAGHTGAYDWDRVLRHEYTHTVGLERTKNHMPHWFTEAQAVYLEQAPRDYATVQLLARAVERDELFDLRAINVAFTRPEKPTDRAQAYAQGHWMLAYMIGKFGPQAPVDLLTAYRAGLREPEAFERVLHLSREKFLEGFKPWAAAQLGTWGMTPPDGMPTVLELIERAARAAEATSAAGDAAPAAQGGGGSAAPLKELKAGAEHAPTVGPAQLAAWLAEYPTHPDLLEAAVKQALADSDGVPTPALKPLLERYAAARPVDPMPHRHLARLALETDDLDAAAQELTYLDLREERAASYAAELASISVRRAGFEQASAAAERATRLEPYTPALRELAATIALRRRDLATARRHLEFLAALEPGVELHQTRLAALARMESEGASPPAK
ncbi:hypothetical protein BH11PLA1_BH11PLA1_15800 [soil metagenome]